MLLTHYSYDKCNGAGASCESFHHYFQTRLVCINDKLGPDANCPNAFRNPDDTHVQVACQENDVSLASLRPGK